MCVLGYSGSSWESSFDSQCLEIIRGRGGPGVATATANQRAKKNFSFYIAHFSVLAPALARSAEGGAGVVGSGEPRIAAEGVGEAPSRPLALLALLAPSDNVCRGTLKHVDIPPASVRVCTCTSEAVRDSVDEKHPEISIARYHSAAALVFTLRCERRCTTNTNLV